MSLEIDMSSPRVRLVESASGTPPEVKHAANSPTLDASSSAKAGSLADVLSLGGAPGSLHQPDPAQHNGAATSGKIKKSKQKKPRVAKLSAASAFRPDKAQLRALRANFREAPYPTPQRYQELADCNGLPKRVVIAWFKSSRQLPDVQRELKLRGLFVKPGKRPKRATTAKA